MKALICVLLVTVAASTVQADQPAARAPLKLRLDADGPYLILATSKAGRNYSPAIAAAKRLHPTADSATFASDDLAGARKILLARQPRYILLFIEPEELDVNFAWQWLTLCTELNDDPLVDARTGFITGSTPQDAEAFMDRISAAVNGRSTVPAAFIDSLGPNPQAGKTDFQQGPGSFIIPALGQRLGLSAISHGTEAFTDERLASMRGAGIVHFGGHGSPDRIDDGLRGVQNDKLQLSPCVAFSGACYTAVTHRWYDQLTRDGKVAEKVVPEADSFCLSFLRTGAVAYFAALHPDHGMPVYQEMEYLAYTGASLGDVIKHTYDGVILASGGHLPKFERLMDGMPAPPWSPSEIMLKGTASRVLFGDPAVIVSDAFTDPPFRVEVKEQGKSLHITAVLTNSGLKSSFTDTYFSDLSLDKTQFNDRALITADLPQGWNVVGGVTVLSAAAGGKPIKHRLLGYAIDSGNHRLYVQVDVPSEGFMQSPFRVAGATVELAATP